METLKVKALKCAIRQLDHTWNRERARMAYGNWEVFWKEPSYIAAVKRLQEKLKKKEDERIME